MNLPMTWMVYFHGFHLQQDESVVIVMVTLLSDVIFGMDNAFFDALDLRCVLDDWGLLRHHLLNTASPRSVGLRSRYREY